MPQVGFPGETYNPGQALASQVTPQTPIAPKGPTGTYPGLEGAPGYGQTYPTGDPNNNMNGFINAYTTGVIDPAIAGANQQITGLEGQIGLAGAADVYGQQQAGQTLANQQAQLGIQQGDISFLNFLYPQQHAITEQGFAAQKAEAQRQEGIQERNIMSDATARGSINTVGTRQGLQDSQANLAYQLGGIGRSQQQSNLGYQQQQHTLTDMSKQLGISETQIQQQFQNSINQLGLQDVLTVDQAIQAIGQARQGEYTPIAGLLGDLYQMSGLQLPGK